MTATGLKAEGRAQQRKGAARKLCRKEGLAERRRGQEAERERDTERRKGKGRRKQPIPCPGAR